MKVHSEQTPSEAGGGSVREESVKEEEVTSETSAHSPELQIPLRPRQGSRSSI
jgi:hypothetical protein